MHHTMMLLGGADLAAVFWGVLDTNRNEYILHRGLAASLPARLSSLS